MLFRRCNFSEAPFFSGSAGSASD